MYSAAYPLHDGRYDEDGPEGTKSTRRVKNWIRFLRLQNIRHFDFRMDNDSTFSCNGNLYLLTNDTTYDNFTSVPYRSFIQSGHVGVKCSQTSHFGRSDDTSERK